MEIKPIGSHEGDCHLTKATQLGRKGTIDDFGVPLVTDPLTRQVMDLFNVSYEAPLLMLQRFFAHTEETDPQLRALADAAVNLMFQAIKPIGDLVTTLPGGPDYPGRTAGPASSCFTSPTPSSRTGRPPGSCSPSASARPPSTANPAPPAPPRSRATLATVRSNLARSPAPSRPTCRPVLCPPWLARPDPRHRLSP